MRDSNPPLPLELLLLLLLVLLVVPDMELVCTLVAISVPLVVDVITVTLAPGCTLLRVVRYSCTLVRRGKMRPRLVSCIMVTRTFGSTLMTRSVWPTMTVNRFLLASTLLTVPRISSAHRPAGTRRAAATAINRLRMGNSFLQ